MDAHSLLQRQVQAAKAEKEEELMTAEVLLSATLALSPLWNPGVPLVKALHLKVKDLRKMYLQVQMCVYIVYILHVYSWIHV